MAPEKAEKKTKNSGKATRPVSPGSRPCPNDRGFIIAMTDSHEACPVCLGMVHTKAALADPDACTNYSQLHLSVRERHVEFVAKAKGNTSAKKDLFPSEPLRPSAELEADAMEDSGALTWGDQMDLHEVVRDSSSQPNFSKFDSRELLHSDKASVTASCNMSDEDDEEEDDRDSEDFSQGATPAPGKADGSTTALFELCRRAAETLK